MDILNLKSELRRRLLVLFFSNPENKYYVRQIERLIGFPAGNISLELRRLNKDGIFKTNRIGGIVFYQLNQKHTIYSELKNIIFKTIGIEGGLRDTLGSLPGIDSAFIFGSFASGNEGVFSDIDLFIIGNPDSDQLDDSFNILENKYQREINYHLYSIEDWKKKKQEDNSFLANILQKSKIFIVGDEQCLKML
ncbi:MAG: nucleotidyltransferase domain-containing protein [Firmicutes bacterium]|nr:nucleotidyltransferase domain-containing protein [Bacillota bacterium]